MTRAANPYQRASYWRSGVPIPAAEPVVDGPVEQDPADEPPTAYELRHGYTLRDLHQMTAAAVRADRSMAMDYADRRDIAWSAIAEHLYAADDPPARHELIRVGWQAIYAEVRAGYRHHGYADRAWDAGRASAPRFAMYWVGGVTTPSHEDSAVERLALPQILGGLGDVYREALVALAAHGHYETAAAALDISYKALVARLVVARRHAIQLWLQPETPHRSRHTDRRVAKRGGATSDACPSGHQRTSQNTILVRRVVRGQLRRQRRCRDCQRERDRARRAA